MPPKSKAKSTKGKTKEPTPSTDNETSGYDISLGTSEASRYVSLSLVLEDESNESREYRFLTLFNGTVISDCQWENGLNLSIGELPLNLNELYYQEMVADKPLIFLLQSISGKISKDPDPLLNIDNFAGGTVDLLPLLLGEEVIYIKVPLVSITTGSYIGYNIIVNAVSTGISNLNKKKPLVITMLAAYCLPPVKEGTVYTAAIGLDGVINEPVINFGMSLSNSSADKIVWATANTVGFVANTHLSIPNEDEFICTDLEILRTENCTSCYWNSMKRILVDPLCLLDRLSSIVPIEIAGGVRTGKTEVRGRFMGFVDPGVLLEQGQFCVTIATKLVYYNEADVSEKCGPLLDIPPSSAKSTKSTGRDIGDVMDENLHNAFVSIRFDLTEPLVPKVKITSLYKMVGFPLSEVPTAPVDELYVDPPPEDTSIDVKRISKESGALAVHQELSTLACRGAIQMNQGIKRTAANRLLTRVRAMIKQFPPGECSILDFQSIVTSQHAACRRAVTASFAPQPPTLRPPSRFAASRCRQSGDYDLAEKHVDTNLTVAPNHPRSLLSKALRYLEQRIDSEARKCLVKALSFQARNRYLLWIYGGQEFDKGPQAIEEAAAAFRIAAKGDYSDATTGAIGWAALHSLQHYKGSPYAAFVAAKEMRKSYELPRDWKNFLKRWINSSGEEQVYWIPEEVGTQNPLLIAAAFFLCLRCYKFVETLLNCVECKCASRGSRTPILTKIGPDIHYLRAASLLLRRRFDDALKVTEEAIKIYGPSGKMFQIRASCLTLSQGWDGRSETVFKVGESLGVEPCPFLLLQAAMGAIKTNPQGSLQNAARAHKIAPSARSALVIARTYDAMGEENLATRWAAVAVKTEPLLADGWAFLALLAINERNIDKAKAMLRTAEQAGKVSADINKELKNVKNIFKIEEFPNNLLDDLCFCHYY